MESCSTGRSTAEESGGGGTYDAVVAAHSRALATISHEIAEAIRFLSAPTHALTRSCIRFLPICALSARRAWLARQARCYTLVILCESRLLSPSRLSRAAILRSLD